MGFSIAHFLMLRTIISPGMIPPQRINGDRIVGILILRFAHIMVALFTKIM